MKMLKNYIATIFVWSVILIPGRADIGLRVANVEGVVGDVVSVPVYVDTSLTSLNILSYQIAVEYNVNLLEALEPTFESTIAASWGDPVSNINTAGKVTVSHAGVTPLSGTGVLTRLWFRLKSNGTAYLNLANDEQTIFNEGEVPVHLTNGRITISPAPYFNFSPNGGLIAIGETLQYYVSRGTAPYTWSTTDLTVATISSTGVITGVSPGKVKVIATDDAGVIDTAGYWVEVVPFTVTVRDTSYYQNNRVTIPVNISQLDDFDVMSGEIKISFNDDILMAEEVIFAGSLLEAVGAKSANLNQLESVSVSFASPEALSGSGPLFYIRFKVDDRTSGATWIEVTHAMFNETLKARAYRGYFSIVSLPNLSVTPSTGQLLAGETLDFNVSGGIEPYQWSVSNPAIASIDANGLLAVNAGGQVRVLVTDPRGSTGQSGIIEIYDGTIELGNVSIPADGESVQMPVYLNSYDNMLPVISISGVIGFNSSNIQQISLNNVGSATQSWSYSQLSEADHFQFAGAGVSGVNGDVTMLGLEVFIQNGLNVGQVIPLSFSEILMNEGNPRLRVVAGSVEIAEPTALDENLKDEIKVIYESGIVRIENLPNDTRWLTLYSLTGQPVLKTMVEGNVYTLVKGQFVKGIYIVEIFGNNKIYLKIKL
ncbi:cohesin domain-containing protein [Carboxylicivirga linearis]|uniref:Ig-like domain-containing protein n=1 Tax=Carboxylicivirga linearis TaxID=1628157 RepID=A0ABS5JU24_9BACT|nr:cohesin domain-containing protein [Carboxylicivirga linearis]MBS2098337.1 Ig-like domain-containing protein [Carboxylicivirga linearis]